MHFVFVGYYFYGEFVAVMIYLIGIGECALVVLRFVGLSCVFVGLDTFEVPL